jgi:hypothetical protein
MVARSPLTANAASSIAACTLGAALWLERRARRAFGDQRQAFERGLALAALDISTQSPDADAAAIARVLGLSLERAQGLVAESEVERLLVTPPNTQRLEPGAAGETLVEPATEPLAPPPLLDSAARSAHRRVPTSPPAPPC